MSIRTRRIVIAEQKTALEDQTADQLMCLLVVAVLDIFGPLTQNKGIEIAVIPVPFQLFALNVEIFARFAVLPVAVERDDRILHEIVESALECGRLILFPGIQICLADRIGKIQVRNEHIVDGWLSGEEDPACDERFFQRLRDHAVAVDALAFRTVFNAEGCPVDRVRIGNTPVQIAVFFVDAQDDIGTDLVIFPEPFCAQIGIERGFIFRRKKFDQIIRQESEFAEFPGKRIQIFESRLSDSRPERGIRRIFAAELIIGGGRGGKSLPVRSGNSAEHFHHLRGDHEFVIPLGIVEHIADLVLIDPAEFTIEQGIVRIVVERLVSDQFDPALYPAPAVDRRSECDGNIVRHIPRKISGRSGEFRLEFRDPRSQLDHLKIFALLLEGRGAKPEHIGKKSAETAQRNGREGDHRRQPFDACLIHQLVFLDDGIHLFLHENGAADDDCQCAECQKPEFEFTEKHLITS